MAGVVAVTGAAGALGRAAVQVLRAAGWTVAGIDLRRVLDSGVLPVINTGIAHRLAGVGQIGAGLLDLEHESDHADEEHDHAKRIGQGDDALP